MVAYLEDWLFVRTTSNLAVLDLVANLGFNVNLKKSRLKPMRVFQWLGIYWNTSSAEISIPKPQRNRIASLAKSFSKRKFATRRDQERILGSLLFLSVTDPILKCRLMTSAGSENTKTNRELRDVSSKVPRTFKRFLDPG